MYTLFRHACSRDWILTEGPSLIGSLLIAELLYKFHSFILECTAFLATWLVISFALAMVAKAIGPKRVTVCENP